jgi:signal transduction histidine kinase
MRVHSAAHKEKKPFAGWIFAILMAALSTLPAEAREHITERFYVEDPSGAWTLEQAQLQPLQSFDGILAKGYGKGVLWVRLRIDPSQIGAAADEPLYLRIRPTYLDQLVLYDEAEEFLPRAPIGDRYPLASQNEHASVYVFRIRSGSEPRDLWLRIQTTSTRMAYIEVLNESVFRKSSIQLITYGGIFLGLMTLFTAFGIWQLLLRRDVLNGSFALFQIVTLLYGATNLGYLRLWTSGWLAPAFLDRMFSLLAVLFVVSILLYSFSVLQELGRSRIREWVFGTFILLFGVVLVLQFAGNIELALQMNVLLGLPLPLLFLADALFFKNSPDAEKKPTTLNKNSVVIYFSITLLFGYFFGLPAVGWSPAIEITLYSTLIYSISSGLLMLWMIQHRSNAIQKQREDLLSQAQQANEKAQLEHAQRLERDRLIAMLGHELKTPLATLRMMLGDNTLPQQTAQQLSEPLKDINELIERTVQTGQLENDAIGLRPVACRLADTVQHAANYLPFAERLVWNILPPADQQTVEADPFLLGVVVRNLLDNALKYSPDDATIDVDLHADTTLGKWVLEVHNPVGRAGLPDPAHVFDKFYRSPKASYRSGSGQGLFIAWRLAQLMGGELRYLPSDSTVCFSLTLPFSAPAKPKPAA